MGVILERGWFRGIQLEGVVLSADRMITGVDWPKDAQTLRGVFAQEHEVMLFLCIWLPFFSVRTFVH